MKLTKDMNERFYLAVEVCDKTKTYEIVGFTNELTHGPWEHWRQKLESKNQFKISEDGYEENNIFETFNIDLDKITDKTYNMYRNIFLNNSIHFKRKKYLYPKCVIVIDDDKVLDLSRCSIELTLKELIIVKFKESNHYYEFEYIDNNKSKLKIHSKCI